MLKRASRAVIFSALALLFTSYWNKGFILDQRPEFFLEAVIITAVGFYLILPIAKIILIPINFLTLGLISTVVYFAFMYGLDVGLNIFDIKDWIFEGLQTKLFSMPQLHISYVTNVFLCGASMSFVMNTLETLL